MKVPGQKKFFRTLWVGIPVTAFALGLASRGWAATYNFYFNNTEQGDNSTATPNVSITDGKATKSGGDAEAAKAAPAVDPVAVPGPAPASSAEAPAAAPAQTIARAELHEYEAPSRKVFHLGFGPVVIWQDQDEIYDYGYGYGGNYGYDGPTSYTTRQARGGMAVSLGARLSRGFGVNVYAGTYLQGNGWDVLDGNAKPLLGAEVEFVPMHVSIGKMEDLIEGGFMLGGNTVRHAEDNWASAYIGAKLQFNLGREFAIEANARANLGYVMPGMSLVYRF